jgi:tetratricopeptide (TPR) repeat protein
MGYPLEGVSTSLRSLPVVWPLGVGLVAAAWWLLGPWLARGELTLAAVVIPQIVLLINLLAAGAMVFPAVITTLLVLTPVALLIARRGNHANDDVVATPRRRAQILGHLVLSPAAAGVVTLASVAVAVACLYTEYYPVLNGRLALADALYRLDQRQYREAEPKTIDAAKADSLSPEPWRLLGELRLAQWQATGRPKDWEEFVEAADTFRKLDPRHHVAWYTRGTWFLTAWKKSNRKEDLDEAITAYTAASAHYPNRALYHAQLAWTLHLAGREDAARQEAKRAFELDQKMPHKEQKLSRQHVVDPDLTKKPERTFLDESAEQTIERLRNPSVEEKS